MPRTESGVKGQPGYESVRKNSREQREGEAFHEGYMQAAKRLKVRGLDGSTSPRNARRDITAAALRGAIRKD